MEKRPSLGGNAQPGLLIRRENKIPLEAGHIPELIRDLVGGGKGSGPRPGQKNRLGTGKLPPRVPAHERLTQELGYVVTPHEARVINATRGYKGFNREHRKKATESEHRIANLVGGVRQPEGSPYDVIRYKDRTAYEIKSLFENESGRLTFHPESIELKNLYASRYGLVPWTIAIDYTAGKMDTPDFYVRKGGGGWDLTTMIKMPEGEINRHITEQTDLFRKRNPTQPMDISHFEVDE